MLLFFLGLLCGVVLVAALSQMYVHRQLHGLRRDLALLRARLRTVVRLAEAGMLEPTSIEAASALNDLHHFVMVRGAVPVATDPSLAADTDIDQAG